MPASTTPRSPTMCSQKDFLRLLGRSTVADASLLDVLSRRLRRWAGEPAAMTLALLRFWRTKMPPTIRTSILLVAYNAWPTSRRFQGTAPCILCGAAEGSVEHYLACPSADLRVIPCFRDRPRDFPDDITMSTMLALVDDTDRGLRIGCYIDALLHATRICRYHHRTDPISAAASRLKQLWRRWPRLRTLFAIPPASSGAAL